MINVLVNAVEYIFFSSALYCITISLLVLVGVVIGLILWRAGK